MSDMTTTCGDGGCVFRPPSDRGQHTNAGCRCLPLRMTPHERVDLRKRIRSAVVALDAERAASAALTEQLAQATRTQGIKDKRAAAEARRAARKEEA